MFLRPVPALAGATAALSAAVGFLPVRGAAAGLGPLATGAAVSLLALTGALIQPRAGRAADAGRLPRPSRYGRRARPGGHRVRRRPDPPGWPGCWPSAAVSAWSPRWASHPFAPHQLGGWVRPWAPPRSAANSATSADPCCGRPGQHRRARRRAAGAGGRPAVPRWPCGHPTTVGLSRISCKPCATGSNPTSGGRRVGVVGNQVLGLAHAVFGWFGAAPSSPSTPSSLALVGDQAGAARRPCADVHPPPGAGRAATAAAGPRGLKGWLLPVTGLALAAIAHALAQAVGPAVGHDRCGDLIETCR